MPADIMKVDDQAKIDLFQEIMPIVMQYLAANSADQELMYGRINSGRDDGLKAYDQRVHEGSPSPDPICAHAGVSHLGQLWRYQRLDEEPDGRLVESRAAAVRQHG
ncbi:hypothetical protein [Sphingomonas sp. PvP018]|uniref:hypothetical protein n=1 Tax=Sphingomonas sp. PvP018 TaxID=2817852 RepID=UPI001AE69DFA|nr:hypothetical protein [Sphingomonas sp. PvP018]MBP2513757.1 hypothetical protein [Sphingomonas sp. PvP018]